MPALPFGRASPGEFPWLCRVEDASTGAFVANCAVVPTDLDNDVSSSGATDRVITVAHRIRGRRTRSVMGGGGGKIIGSPNPTNGDREWWPSLLLS